MTALQKREFVFSDRDFHFLTKLVYERVGIVLGDHKRDMVYARLARRIRKLGIGSFREYCALLEGSEGSREIGHLVNAITTNLTSFFREPHHFDHLREHVFAPFAANAHTDARLRIWSAGCSYGAEPYSIAMTLLDTIGNAGNRDVKILATDIDTDMLDKGRNGIYSAQQTEKIPPSHRALFTKYTINRKSEDKIRMLPQLQDLIRFNTLNLLEPWPFRGTFDAVFCRNVVIYFDKPTQSSLFNRIADILKPGGWLYIGHSESLFNICDRFSAQGKTVYRKER